MLDGIPDPQGKGRFGWSNPQPKHAIANCSQIVSPMLPPIKYERRIGWTCHSDSAFCQITLVLIESSRYARGPTENEGQENKTYDRKNDRLTQQC